MYVDVKNENYGYAVATFGDFVAVGNPGVVRYNPASTSVNWSGSVDVFRYDYGTDQHVYVGTLYKDNVLQEVLLAAETGSPTPPPVSGSLISASLKTEPTGSDVFTQNSDIQIDRVLYTHMAEDGYGKAIDIYDKVLIVGCPYYLQHVETTASFQSVVSGSNVDIFDLRKYEQDSIKTTYFRASSGILALGTGSKSGYFRIYTNDVPEGYDLTELRFSEVVTGPYNQVVARAPAPANGGYQEFYIHSSIISVFPTGFFQFAFSYDESPYLLTFQNPDPETALLTGSFGHAVSINDGWVAISSPQVSGSNGMVYIYKNETVGNEFSWSLQQKLVPNDSTQGLLFGSSVELNKVTCSLSGSLIVGIGNNSGSKAFLFEYWPNTYPHSGSVNQIFQAFNGQLTGSFTGSATVSASISASFPFNINVEYFSGSAVNSSLGGVYYSLFTGSFSGSITGSATSGITGSVTGSLTTNIGFARYTGSVSGSNLIISGAVNGSEYGYFWQQTYTFTPNLPSSSLTFGTYLPYTETFTTASAYGTAVAMYKNTVVIGASKDRLVTEYSGSYQYEQGSVYVYERCTDGCTQRMPADYYLAKKTYGDSTILKNNRLGYSVGVYGDYVAAGTPKRDVVSMQSCYVQDTLEQLHYCEPDLENTLIGQTAFLMRNTASNEWELAKVYQKKKKYLSPYRSYGFSVDVGDKSMVIGAPMILADLQREMNIAVTKSFNTDISDIAGKAYIYNLQNYRPEFHVGNVFYRNGRVILMTSGSIFDGLLFNPISVYTYEYQIDFKSEHTIYEKQMVCSVTPGEFNVSTNPTAITREIPEWDINQNGIFDFQDVDVLLSYMQYKNTQLYGTSSITTNWSSSIVTADDEKSLLRYYEETYDSTHTNVLISESIQRFENVDTYFQSELDLNQDNRIDSNDLNIMWKYFTKRLTQENYRSYITPACSRKYFSDIIDHMDNKTKIKATPMIRSGFFDYERLSEFDKTGSFLAPMATTIGLYDGLDLVAVAKLGSPVKITPELPINFVVKMDF